MRLTFVIILVLAFAAGLYWLSELRRLETRSTRLQEAGDALRFELESLRTREARLDAELSRIREELSGSLGREEAMTEALRRQVEEIEAQRDSLRSERLADLRMMPEGLRQSLTDLNDCLRVEGYGEFRFHRARSIEAGELRGAELIEHQRGSLKSVSYVAGKLAIELNREASTVSMTLYEGSMTTQEGIADFPEAGFPIVLSEVDGPMWESRLPYLVRATGDYPVETIASRNPGLDRVTKSVWLERVEHLLSIAKTDMRYRLQKFHDLEDGRFIDALLLAYVDGRRLSMSAEAETLQIVVDRRAESVSLILRGGILRKVGGESKISSSGYRILLPGVTVEECIEVMLGMVGER